MFKQLLIGLCLLLSSAVLPAQTKTDPDPGNLPERIRISKPDSNRIDLQLQLGKYYLDKQGSYKADLDSAMILFNQALQESRDLHMVSWENKALLLKGACYLEGSNIPPGKSCYMQVIDYYRKTGDKKQEALTWADMGYNLFDFYDYNKQISEEKEKAFGQARALFAQIHDKFNEAEMLRWVANAHYYQGKLDLAETELLQVLDQFKAIHNPKLTDTYQALSDISMKKGDLHKQLFYTQEAVKTMEATNDTLYAAYAYYGLAAIYGDIGLIDNSLTWTLKTIEKSKQDGNYTLVYMAAIRVLHIFVSKNKPEEAMSFFQKLIKQRPPAEGREKERMYAGLGYCYNCLKDYPNAERNYLKMIRIADTIYGSKILAISNYVQDYKIISNFYVTTKQSKKARYYLEKLLTLPTKNLSPISVSEIQALLFTVDSTSGKYLSAINHLEANRKLTDSLFNATKNKQLQEVEAKYETGKKDQDLRLQAKDIELLKKQSLLQQSQVQQTRTARNVLIGGSGLLLLLLGVGYNRYRLKQRSNRQLQAQQTVISGKNRALEKLLRDNEWLLKEVHHRVKNNLQIVMSLLNSQSAYLKDEAALSAVMESQNRIQAMSLIHQKLYKTNNTSDIYMPEYIHDLVDYLKDSCKTRQTIYFDLQIETIKLDVLRAVPVGLILNESITNAIKYAFPVTGSDRISVRLFQSSPGQIRLIVADNGQGLPPGLDIDKSASFGMTLMRGLTEDLGGVFTIGQPDSETFGSTGGTMVSMTFENWQSPFPGNNDLPEEHEGDHQ